MQQNTKRPQISSINWFFAVIYCAQENTQFSRSEWYFLKDCVRMSVQMISMIIPSMRSDVPILTRTHRAMWFTRDLGIFLRHWHGETSDQFKNRSPFSWVTQERRDLQKYSKPVSGIASIANLFEQHCVMVYWVVNFIAVEKNSELGHDWASAAEGFYH